MYPIPKTPRELIAFDQTSHFGAPKHIIYKCKNIELNISEETTYKDSEISRIDIYFGVNDQETK